MAIKFNIIGWFKKLTNIEKIVLIFVIISAILLILRVTGVIHG